jgi:hypothetical protein
MLSTFKETRAKIQQEVRTEYNRRYLSDEEEKKE